MYKGKHDIATEEMDSKYITNLCMMIKDVLIHHVNNTLNKTVNSCYNIQSLIDLVSQTYTNVPSKALTLMFVLNKYNL